jgi:hypothetical protein
MAACLRIIAVNAAAQAAASAAAAAAEPYLRRQAHGGGKFGDSGGGERIQRGGSASLHPAAPRRLRAVPYMCGIEEDAEDSATAAARSASTASGHALSAANSATQRRKCLDGIGPCENAANGALPASAGSASMDTDSDKCRK